MAGLPKERKPTFLGRQELGEEKRVDFLREKIDILFLEEKIPFARFLLSISPRENTEKEKYF